MVSLTFPVTHDHFLGGYIWGRALGLFPSSTSCTFCLSPALTLLACFVLLLPTKPWESLSRRPVQYHLYVLKYAKYAKCKPNPPSCFHFGHHGTWTFGAGNLTCKKSLPKPKEWVAKWWQSRNFYLEGWNQVWIKANWQEVFILSKEWYLLNRRQPRNTLVKEVPV